MCQHGDLRGTGRATCELESAGLIGLDLLLYLTECRVWYVVRQAAEDVKRLELLPGVTIHLQ